MVLLDDSELSFRYTIGESSNFGFKINGFLSHQEESGAWRGGRAQLRNT